LTSPFPQKREELAVLLRYRALRYASQRKACLGV